MDKHTTIGDILKRFPDVKLENVPDTKLLYDYLNEKGFPSLADMLCNPDIKIKEK